MLVSLFSCPFCDEQMEHVALIKHLKQQHNSACARLIEFYDPRYYLRLVKAVIKNEAPLYNLQIFEPRNDGVFTSHSQLPDDLKIRRIAFAFQRKRAFYQYAFEYQNKKFLHRCFLCDTVLRDVSRRDALQHYEQHGLRVGGVEGVVYVYKLLAVLEYECAKNRCLLCDAQFADVKQLYKHLKNRNHLRFKSGRTDVDCCFLNNYREYQKSWRYNDEEADTEQRSDENFIELSSDDEYDYELDSVDKNILRMLEEIPHIDLLLEQDDSAFCKCLFCASSNTVENVLYHMATAHQFDMRRILDLNDTYQRIMQINYFRRKVDVMQCPLCDTIFADAVAMQEHFTAMQHGYLRVLQDYCDIIPFCDNDLLLYLAVDED